MTNEAYLANLTRGRLLRETGRFQEACDLLGKAIEAEPNIPDPYLEMALALSEIPGKSAESLDAIDRAVALEPGSAKFSGYKAYLLSQFGDHYEALNVCFLALRKNPNERIALLAQANANTKLNHWNAAEATSRYMLALDPNDAAALNLLAQSLRFQERLNESNQQIEQVLAGVPGDSFGHANAGYIALKIGDFKRANACFLSALRFNPHSEFARLGLLQSIHERSWMFRTISAVSKNFGSEESGGLFRLACVVATIVTGGAALVLFFLYFAIATTLTPLTDFFLLLQPVGQNLLKGRERKLALVTGGFVSLALLALACENLIGLYAPIFIYVLSVGLCIYLPEWSDKLRRTGERPFGAN